ncbi:MAG: hypothetical protein AAFU53_04760, partial [Cyanobacteria bacterium J06632_3]
VSNMHEHIATPHFPAVVLAFIYRGMQIEITTSQHHNRQIYSAWVTYATGSAVAVPRADSRERAIALAKRWVNTHFDWSPSAT